MQTLGGVVDFSTENLTCDSDGRALPKGYVPERESAHPNVNMIEHAIWSYQIAIQIFQIMIF